MAGRFQTPNEQFLDENGDPLAGGKLEFFESGTSTPQDTYSDDDLNIPNTNPVILDNAGRAGDIFLDNSDYKVVLKRSDDTVVWTADPVRSTTPKSSEVRTVTTTTQLDTSDDGKWIAADATGGSFVVTLPAVATVENGYEVTAQKVDSSANSVTLDGSGSETINGVSDVTLDQQYEAITVRSDGTRWLSPLEEGRALPPEHIDGLTLSNGADPATDVTIAAGSARSDDDAANIVRQNPITKKLNAAFAEGNNQGGLDTGTVQADTTYHVFVISKADGTADGLFSTSATSPALPSGFTNKRRIGQILTDNSSNIIENMFGEVKTWGEIHTFEVTVSGDPTIIELGRGLLSGFTEISVNYSELAMSGGDETILQLSSNGTIVSSGYAGTIGNIGGSITQIGTTGFQFERDQVSTRELGGIMILERVGQALHTWSCLVNSGRDDGSASTSGAGKVDLTSEFDGARLTSIGGTQTFADDTRISCVMKKYK